MTTESHSYAEQYARDLEINGNARIVLNVHGEPARARASAHYLATVANIEPLTRDRVRVTLDNGRTLTMNGGRWVLCEYSAWRGGCPDGLAEGN